MRLNKQTFQMVALDGVTDRLKEHPRNPKRGHVGAIHESINVNGWFGCVLAQESTGYILAGNHKYRTAVQQKAAEVPVLWIDVDDEAALRILLADNQVAALGEMDEAALDAVLAELPDLAGTGYGDTLMKVQEQAEAEAAGGDFHLHPEDVPDDSYEPKFGVLVECADAKHQEKVYRRLDELQAGDYMSEFEGTTLKVVTI